MKRYFNIDGEGGGTFFPAMAAAAAHPADPVLQYLVGRDYYLSRAYQGAALALSRATRLDLGDVDLTREAYRLNAVALAQRNECDAAASVLKQFVAAGGVRAEAVQVGDWVDRCRFAVARKWRPL